MHYQPCYSTSRGCEIRRTRCQSSGELAQEIWLASAARDYVTLARALKQLRCSHTTHPKSSSECMTLPRDAAHLRITTERPRVACVAVCQPCCCPSCCCCCSVVDCVVALGCLCSAIAVGGPSLPYAAFATRSYAIVLLHTRKCTYIIR